MGAPDRIFARQVAMGFRGAIGTWNVCEHDDIDRDEYIRADLVQSLIQAAHDLDRQYCDDDLGPSAMAMGKLREAYMRLK